MAKGKQIIEETYDIVISSKARYFEQIAGLDAAGAFSNTKMLTEVVFKLCEIIDTQERQIAELQKLLPPDGQTEHNANNPPQSGS